jgi:hypothetical protein
MHTLNRVCLALLRQVKQASLLPRIMANILKQRRRQGVHNELEAERLDRIRNPSKYLGK